MGIRLLTLDATVVLVPADVTSPVRRSKAAGGGLAEAVRSLNEGAEVLAQAQRIRST